jgi:GAF domain-containing protein
MLGQVNRCIARVETCDALWTGVCRGAVEQGGFSVAWVGLLGEAARTVTAVASHGESLGELPSTPFSVAPHGHDAMARAVSGGRAVVTTDPADQVRLLPRRQPIESAAVRAVVRAVAVVPFRCRGHVVGVLTVGSADTSLVEGPGPLGLLDLLADDISHALDALEVAGERRRAARVDAHQGVLSDATIESLPGIYYLIDTAGRFVRWNA